MVRTHTQSMLKSQLHAPSYLPSRPRTRQPTKPNTTTCPFNPPSGWMHYQFNANCTQARTILAFNAKAVGTVGVPLALAASDPAYLQTAYNVSRFPSPGAVWVVDQKCKRACRLSRR